MKPFQKILAGGVFAIVIGAIPIFTIGYFEHGPSGLMFASVDPSPSSQALHFDSTISCAPNPADAYAGTCLAEVEYGAEVAQREDAAIADTQAVTDDSPADVPEPGALLLMGLGILGTGIARRLRHA